MVSQQGRKRELLAGYVKTALADDGGTANPDWSPIELRDALTQARYNKIKKSPHFEWLKGLPRMHQVYRHRVWFEPSQDDVQSPILYRL